MISKVPVEISLSFGLVAGPKAMGRGVAESNALKTAGGEDRRNVALPHVLFHLLNQRRLHVESDLIQDHGRLQRVKAAVSVVTSSTHSP
jgi:hypothetical protein